MTSSGTGIEPSGAVVVPDVSSGSVYSGGKGDEPKADVARATDPEFLRWIAHWLYYTMDEAPSLRPRMRLLEIADRIEELAEW